MTIIKWNRRPMLSDMLDEMFEKNFSTGFERKCGCVPATNIIEDNDTFVIELAAPGMKKEDFRLEMENNVLSIVFEKKEEEKTEGEYLQREFHMDEFTRSFTMPKIADVENIKARYDNGILYVSIPKIEKAKLSKQIKVS
ncbi:MAG: Hsp20/alpha crystallin family protein [Bacteroidales bacterium]|nr:Hsp20/alpha crystallin family protein [Bacteroidales bacterium]